MVCSALGFGGPAGGSQGEGGLCLKACRGVCVSPSCMGPPAPEGPDQVLCP